MKKFLDSDWLREVQFQGNTVPKKGNIVICIELLFFGAVLLFSCILLIARYLVQFGKTRPCEFFKDLKRHSFGIVLF